MYYSKYIYMIKKTSVLLAFGPHHGNFLGYRLPPDREFFRDAFKRFFDEHGLTDGTRRGVIINEVGPNGLLPDARNPQLGISESDYAFDLAYRSFISEYPVGPSHKRIVT
jgi:hypothetical protein